MSPCAPRRFAAAFLIAAALALTSLAAAPSVAVAQAAAADRDDPVSPKQRREFSLCRATALVHLSEGDWNDAVFDEALTRMLLQQISVTMAETVYARPPSSISDADRRILFAERFFVDLRESIGDAMAAYPTVVERDKKLLSCAPYIWTILAGHVDTLMAWRDRAFGGDVAPAWRFEELGDGAQN